MMNAFIVKNADESFDQYYNQMRKRKGGHTNAHGAAGGSLDNTMA
jgi:hypothetical protein